MSEKRTAARRFWLAGKRDAEQDRFFREALEPLGWQAGHDSDWDAGWVTGMPDPAQFRRVSPYRKINHFPGNAALTVKSRLHDSLVTLRERIHESHGVSHELAARLRFFPRAYVMPRDYHSLQEAALANPAQRWILKPTNASKGKGIRILKDVAEAPLAPDWMVQEYIANPHTIRGHKYVLRLYVLIASLDPLRVYLYRQGFAKLASEPWDPDDADNPYSQLTNPDINARNDRAEVPVEFIDLDRYRQWLRDQGHDDGHLFAQIQDLVALTAIAGVDALRSRTAQVGADPRGCYELLGLDCLVDDTLKPWILECNLSPSLGICAAPESGGRVEEAVKGGLVRDLVSLVDIDGAASADEARSSPDGEGLMAEAQAERARAGGFEPLLPATQEPARYLPYFSLPTLADLQLAEGLSGVAAKPPVLQRRAVAELLDDDQLALYATRTGRYYRPNDTAALIWLLATEGLDPDAIAEQLVEATTTQAGGLPDLQALRHEVWAILGEWCRAGLLCQQGTAEQPMASAATDEPATDALATPSPASGRVMQLAFDDRHWALHVAGGPALGRLVELFGSWLSPLSDEAASRLPRLAVLREPAGYTLAADDAVVAARLSLAQLGPVLTGHLLRQAATPDRPVIDAGLLIGPGGTSVLCLLSGDAASSEAMQSLVASGITLTRGVRLTLSDLPRVEPLGLPMPDLPAGRSGEVPSSIEIQAVLWDTPGANETPGPVAMLDLLGALLPRCTTDTARPPTANTVMALGDWLAQCERGAIALDEATSTSTPISDWLATLGEPALDAGRADTATAG